MPECSKFEACTFIKTYESHAPTTIQSIIDMYCKGEKSDECLRLKYLSKVGEDPVETMMPTGRDVESGQIIRF